MSKNVKVNDATYNGVSTVELPLSDGSGNAQFKDVDEITTPSGSVTITENGTHDVTNYASAVVNVAGESGGATAVVLLATATAIVDDSTTNGKVVFTNLQPLEPHTIYAIRCTEEQTSDIYECVICTSILDVAEPYSQLGQMGARKKSKGSSGDYSGSIVLNAAGASVNDDGTVNITFNALGGSYNYKNCYTYNLYKLGTYPTEY